MFLFYVLSFFKKRETIQGGILIKGIWYAFDVLFSDLLMNVLNNQNLYIISFSDCAVTMTQLLGVITSPGFPHLYRNGIDCTWNIQLQIGQLINITFLHFALDNYWTFNTEYTEEEW